jgi:hypothetical protein
VTFRTALSSRASNFVLSFSRWLKRHGMMQSLPSPVTASLHAISVLPRFGDPNGGLAVELRGDKGGEPLVHSVFLVARDGNTPAIAAAPAIALIRKWTRQGVSTAGVTPCVGLLDWTEVRNELMEYDIVLVRT